MELTKQVVSLELAKRLKELGVKQESVFWYTEKKEDLVHITSRHLARNSWIKEKYTGAFTTAELGQAIRNAKLRNGIKAYAGTNHCSVLSGWKKTDVGSHRDTLFLVDLEKEKITEADARAKMLIYLIENKLITV